MEAYESWLRARELLTRGTRESVAQSRVMYRRAIEIDLNFARPHAGLALAAISEYVSGWAPDPAQALDEAERWARRAVELSDQEPVSHLALGAVLLWRRDHEGALAESRRMMALDPNFAQGYRNFRPSLLGQWSDCESHGLCRRGQELGRSSARGTGFE